MAKPFRIAFLEVAADLFQQRDRIIKPTYTLGRVIFSITNCDAVLEREFQMLLPICNEGQPAADRIYDAKADSINTLVDLINRVHREHEETVWILGASLVSPSGHKVLLSGPSKSGKSTTAMALVIGSGWKVISEDITHIDLRTDEIINFASPFAVKAGAMDLIKDAVQAELGSFEISSKIPSGSNTWIPIGANSLGRNTKAPFDFIFHFDQLEGDEFRCKKLAASEYIRAILPGSNIARSQEAANKIYDYALENHCYRISGGSLQQRLQTIINLCENNLVLKDEEKTA